MAKSCGCASGGACRGHQLGASPGRNVVSLRVQAGIASADRWTAFGMSGACRRCASQDTPGPQSGNSERVKKRGQSHSVLGDQFPFPRPWNGSMPSPPTADQPPEGHSDPGCPPPPEYPNTLCDEYCRIQPGCWERGECCHLVGTCVYKRGPDGKCAIRPSCGPCTPKPGPNS